MPREHGLIMIWSSTVLLGVVQGIFHLQSVVGLLIGVIFGISIILSYTAINLLFNSRFRKVSHAPLVMMAGTSALAFLWRVDLYSLLFFGILGVLVLIWGAHSFLVGGRTSYTRTVIGTMAVSLQFPIIYNLAAGIDSQSEFLWTASMWWMYFGVTLVLILAVGNYREKIPRYTTVAVWTGFLLVTIPFFTAGVLHPVTAIFLVDPTLRSIYHAVFNPTLRKNRINIRKVGWNLTMSTFLFLFLSVVLTLDSTAEIIHSFAT